MKKYTCTGCKSVFYEGNVPAKCPICGCEAGFFKVTTASDDEVKANSAEEAKPTQPEPQNNVYSANASKQDVVTVWGYYEYFAIETAVEIYKNGLLIGSVSPKKKMEVPVEGECELKFKCGMFSTICRVKAGDWVVLSMKSQLKAILANPNNYEEIVAGLQEEADSSKSTRIKLLLLGLIIFVVGFGYMYFFMGNVHSYSASPTWKAVSNLTELKQQLKGTTWECHHSYSERVVFDSDGNGANLYFNLHFKDRDKWEHRGHYTLEIENAYNIYEGDYIRVLMKSVDGVEASIHFEKDGTNPVFIYHFAEHGEIHLVAK